MLLSLNLEHGDSTIDDWMPQGSYGNAEGPGYHSDSGLNPKWRGGRWSSRGRGGSHDNHNQNGSSRGGQGRGRGRGRGHTSRGGGRGTPKIPNRGRYEPRHHSYRLGREELQDIAKYTLDAIDDGSFLPPGSNTPYDLARRVVSMNERTVYYAPDDEGIGRWAMDRSVLAPPIKVEREEEKVDEDEAVEKKEAGDSEEMLVVTDDKPAPKEEEKEEEGDPEKMEVETDNQPGPKEAEEEETKKEGGNSEEMVEKTDDEPAPKEAEEEEEEEGGDSEEMQAETGDQPAPRDTEEEEKEQEDAETPKMQVETDNNPAPKDAEEEEKEDTEKPKRPMQIFIGEYSTLVGTRKLAGTLTFDESVTNKRIGVLNFASAKKPGGGFLNGSQAQEESIARTSTLYPSLITQTARSFYQHWQDDPDPFYTHAMVYSPDVVIFKNDRGCLRKPIEVDVLTSAAVNAGEVRAAIQDELERKERARIARRAAEFRRRMREEEEQEAREREEAEREEMEREEAEREEREREEAERKAAEAAESQEKKGEEAESLESQEDKLAEGAPVQEETPDAAEEGSASTPKPSHKEAEAQTVGDTPKDDVEQMSDEVLQGGGEATDDPPEEKEVETTDNAQEMELQEAGVEQQLEPEQLEEQPKAPVEVEQRLDQISRDEAGATEDPSEDKVVETMEKAQEGAQQDAKVEWQPEPEQLEERLEDLEQKLDEILQDAAELLEDPFEEKVVETTENVQKVEQQQQAKAEQQPEPKQLGERPEALGQKSDEILHDDAGATENPFEEKVVETTENAQGVEQQQEAKEAQQPEPEQFEEERPEFPIDHRNPFQVAEEKIDAEMYERIARILRVFELQGARNLVLGSFGTGVFQNRIELVAEIWKDLLIRDGARFKDSFDVIVFAILGGWTVKVFEQIFADGATKDPEVDASDDEPEPPERGLEDGAGAGEAAAPVIVQPAGEDGVDDEAAMKVDEALRVDEATQDETIKEGETTSQVDETIKTDDEAAIEVDEAPNDDVTIKGETTNRVDEIIKIDDEAAIEVDEAPNDHVTTKGETTNGVDEIIKIDDEAATKVDEAPKVNEAIKEGEATSQVHEAIKVESSREGETADALAEESPGYEEPHSTKEPEDIEMLDLTARVEAEPQTQDEPHVQQPEEP